MRAIEPVLHRLDVDTILDPDRRSVVTEIVNSTPVAYTWGDTSPRLRLDSGPEDELTPKTSDRYRWILQHAFARHDKWGDPMLSEQRPLR